MKFSCPVRTLFHATLWVSIAALLSSCGGSSEPLNPGKITAFVSVPPQATLVEAIGGEHVVVEVLAGDGSDPHDFSPSARQAVRLGRADAWFTTRMPFERSVSGKVKSGARRLRIVDTAGGVPLFPESQPQPEHAADESPSSHDDHDHHDHDHGDHHHHDHDHDHSAGDPHLWLSPPLLKIQAAQIAAALSDIAPDHRPAFQTNLASFEKQLDEVHGELEKTLAPHRGATFLAYHGAFGWFADAYGLTQEVIEFSGKAPETRRLRRIIENAKARNIRAVFTQPQYDRSSADTVAEGLGGSVVLIDPLDRDLFANLRRIASELATALQAQKQSAPASAVAPAPASADE